MNEREENTEIDNQIVIDNNPIETDSKEKCQIPIEIKTISNKISYIDKIKEINSSIDKLKETFEINSTLYYPEYERNCLNQINKYYKIIDTNSDNQLTKESLIDPFFKNELLDENYVNNFIDEDSIKNSLMYKKYIIKKEDEISYFKTICFEMYNSFLEFVKLRNPNISDRRILINEKYHNYQYFGVTVMNYIFNSIIILYLLIQIMVYCYLTINKKNNSEKKIDAFWENYETNLYKCITLEMKNLLNTDYTFNILCSNGTKFYYISKFGISPLNKEGENIAGCYSSSFKNVIEADEECELSEYLNELLNEYKLKEGNIYIKNISNIIINNCNKLNEKSKFFLSYSCYIPFSLNSNDSKHKTRKEIINNLVLFESFINFIAFLIFYYHFKFFRPFFKRTINIKNMTLMINTIKIEKEKLPFILSEILKGIKNLLLLYNNEYENSYFSLIKEINYSFIDNEEKKIYDKLNFLLRKKDYLLTKVESPERDLPIPRNFICTILSKIFRKLKITYREEYKETEKELKEVLLNIVKRRDNNKFINKIYITFSNYEVKKFLKNKEIKIENAYHKLKKADMYPHDIIWENLNISKKEKIKKFIVSYFLLIIFLLFYFFLIIIISRVNSSFNRKYNLTLDCENIDYKNKINLIYEEYINDKQSTKEKIYSYCYCNSDLNGKNIFFKDLNFNPCKDYNKYKFLRNAFIYLLTIILVIFDLFFVDSIFEKILSIQKFESKSYKNNLTVIFSIIIMVFTNVILEILLNAKLNDKPISFFNFGQFEDFTPHWIREMNESLSYNAFANIGFLFFLELLCKFLKGEYCYKLSQKFRYYTLFFWTNPIIHFYDYFKMYAPEKDYINFSINIIFFFFYLNFLFFIPPHGLFTLIFLLFYIFFSFKIKNKYSHSFVRNKTFFRIIAIFLSFFFILRYLIGIWWYSSEYYFIDINEETYDLFNLKSIDRKLVDKFLQGKASIYEKIQIKLALKRNLFFLLPMFIIIAIMVTTLFICKSKKGVNNLDQGLLELDDYTKIKYYEIYRLLYYKYNLYKSIYLKGILSTNEFYNFIEYKYHIFIENILNDQIEDYHKKIMDRKKELISNQESFINNPINIYSPFLIDEYSVSFTSKFILCPSYT